MSSRDGFFTDRMAYERLMGRWSRLVGEIFLDWIGVPKNLRWIALAWASGPAGALSMKHAPTPSSAGRRGKLIPGFPW